MQATGSEKIDVGIEIQAAPQDSGQSQPADHTAKEDIAAVASQGDLESPMKLGRKMSTNEAPTE